MRNIKQKVIGILTIVMGFIAVPYLLDWDITILFITIPMGLFYIFSKENILD